MTEYLLSFKPAIGPYGYHDPAAALFVDGELAFGTEEERYTRKKHAIQTFPENAIRACVDHAGVGLGEVDRIVLPYDPDLTARTLRPDLRLAVTADAPVTDRLRMLGSELTKHARARFAPDAAVERRLAELGTAVPPVEHRSHHRCHAARAHRRWGRRVRLDGRLACWTRWA